MNSQTMNNFFIRLATEKDAAMVADISRQTFYEAFAKDNTKENMDLFMNGPFNRDALVKEVQEGDGIFILVFLGNDAVGYARLREKNEEGILTDANALEIGRIYTRQAVIGKGAGNALMQYCLQIAANQKKEWIWLGVWAKNERAIAFYKKYGFEKFGEHVFLLGNDVQTDWLMKRKV
jgi:diamine N-acetyltransferase